MPSAKNPNRQLHPPILCHKRPGAEPVFLPQNLLREGRRQRGLGKGDIPKLCVLDPDGDIMRYVTSHGLAERDSHWACYHSDMYDMDLGGMRVGIVGCAVGAPYAVLLAEQMFVSGCTLLISITSSGQLEPLGQTPYYVLVEKAYRDEGTSYHYAGHTDADDDFAYADPALIEKFYPALQGLNQPVHKGATWTTDAPYRETEEVLQAGKAMGLNAIEMESAALYTLAREKAYPILCLAHVTNTMAVNEGDFEKGEAGGATDSLQIIEAIARAMG